jgi:membrane protease YdiL (CAAX protease family)
MMTPAFAAFTAPARRHPQVWRLGLGVLLIALAWAATTAGAFLAAGIAAGLGWIDPAGLEQALATGATPGATLLLLSTFLGLFLGTWLAARLLHGRSLGSLIGERQGVPFMVGVSAIGATLALGNLLPGAGLELAPNLDPAIWAAFLVPAIAALLLQTGAEEVAFRGYLQTQLAARFASPVVWLVLPSVLFGLAHWNPGEFGGNAPLIVAAVTMVGLITADLTRVTGGIGAAWGLHFANNAGGILLAGPTGPLGGLALMRQVTPGDDPSLAPMIAVQGALLVIAWLLVRLWAAKSPRIAA